MDIREYTPSVRFVDLNAQYASINADIDAAVARVINRGDFILGEDVRLFEAEFAAYCGVDFACGVASGTAALELLLRAYGIGEGDEVITAANTFIATTLAISYVGAKPVLVDIDPDTYNIDVNQIEQAITPHTRAIIPVHLYGQPADMDAIQEIANRHHLFVIEDACQAHGARYHGHRTGSLGDAAAFSFYPAKNLGAYGDGGIAVTNDPVIAEKVRMLRDYGQLEKYHHLTIGYNSRLDTLQAAVLRVKLSHLDAWNAARRDHAAHYTRLLAGSEVVTPTVMADVESVWHLYVIRSHCPDGLRNHLTQHNIQTGIHYPIPIHLQPAYLHLGYKTGDFPVTEKYAKEILSLPMYAELQPDAITHVVDVIRAFNPHE